MSLNVNKRRRFFVFRKPPSCAAKRTPAVPFGLIEENKGGRDRRFRRCGAHAVSGSVCLPGPLLCQQVFDRVLHSDALVHSLRIFCRQTEHRRADMSDAARLVTQLHTNFHPFPQMCGHLNASQFYAYRRMTLWDWCVNVMEIAFGLVNANGLLKRGN